MEPLLTCKDVCKWLAVSNATLCRMVRSKSIPHIVVRAGKRKLIVRFREKALEEWARRRSRGAWASGDRSRRKSVLEHLGEDYYRKQLAKLDPHTRQALEGGDWDAQTDKSVVPG